MPPNLIVKQIPIELIYNELGIEETFSNDRKPLSKLCSQKNLNCTLVVDQPLEGLKYSHTNYNPTSTPVPNQRQPTPQPPEPSVSPNHREF